LIDGNQFPGNYELRVTAATIVLFNRAQRAGLKVQPV
jgi:hypothetical protein